MFENPSLTTRVAIGKGTGFLLRVITVFDGHLCTLAEGFLGSTLRANRAVGGAPPGLTPV